jgi:hypothetical protein
MKHLKREDVEAMAATERDMAVGEDGVVMEKEDTERVTLKRSRIPLL